MTTTGRVTKISFIHRSTVFQTIQTKVPIPPKRWFKSLFCSHRCVEPYVRIDYTGGPGSYADNYQGKFCVGCGKVIHEEQTY